MKKLAFTLAEVLMTLGIIGVVAAMTLPTLITDFQKRSPATMVKTLYSKYPESNILKRAIGYKEIIKYLNGEIQLNEAIELIKKNTRHYVKRQYTWFNNQLPVNWFNTVFEDFSKTENEVINFIQTKNKD